MYSTSLLRQGYGAVYRRFVGHVEQKAALYKGDRASTAFLFLGRDCVASRGETYREGKPKKGEKVKWPGLGARIEIPCEFIYSTCVGI